jgi:hypothetical protein
MGKGSARRPSSISADEFDVRWGLTFGFSSGRVDHEDRRGAQTPTQVYVRRPRGEDQRGPRHEFASLGEFPNQFRGGDDDD